MVTTLNIILRSSLLFLSFSIISVTTLRISFFVFTIVIRFVLSTDTVLKMNFLFNFEFNNFLFYRQISYLWLLFNYILNRLFSNYRNLRLHLWLLYCLISDNRFRFYLFLLFLLDNWLDLYLLWFLMLNSGLFIFNFMRFIYLFFFLFNLD